MAESYLFIIIGGYQKQLEEFEALVDIELTARMRDQIKESGGNATRRFT
ncbi:hypothetical protein HNO89_003629 [Sporosarcina luteola]|nr:hypothetical protein [Sporosarcina luteola]